MSTELATVSENITVMAETPAEMHSANQSLIEWCKAKVKALNADHFELFAAYTHAVEHKWKSSTLKRHADLALKRVDFYQKIKKALERGYYIVPNFPVTVFAIRTDKKAPLKLMSTSNWGSHEQKPPALQEGEGDYKNPLPEIWEQTSSVPDSQKPGENKKVTKYWANNWLALDFPINMAKPRIMEASSRVMALKLFDDLGVLPSPYRKADPVIIARILDPRSTSYNRRYVSFMVAWELDTKTL